MAVYELPGAGTLTVHRKGEVHERGGTGIRYRYHVTGTGKDEVTHRTWITVPDHYDETKTVGVAAAAIGFQVGWERGLDTGNEWDVYAESFSEDDHEVSGETAAMYRTDGVSHYRLAPYSYDREAVTFPSIKAVKADLSRSLNSGIPLVFTGDAIDLYPNDSDEPSHRITVGPKGGLTVRQF